MWLDVLVVTLVAGVAAVLWWAVRRAARSAREVPERWRLLGAVDAAFDAGIATRDAVAARLRRAELAVHPGFVEAADELLRLCAELVEMRLETQRHFGGALQDGPAPAPKSRKGRRAALLTAGSPAEGAARRIPHLEALVAEVMAALEEAAGAPDAAAVERLEGLGKRLRDRLDGERHAHRLLSEHFGIASNQ